MLPEIISIVVALIILGVGETLKNETKTKYIEAGYSWRNVIISSNVAGFLGGVLLLVISHYGNVTMNSFVYVFSGTVFSYILVQSFMTDLRILLINRNILRVAYISMYLLGLYNIFSGEQFRSNLFAFVTFTILIFILFMFSSIGASDIRAIAVCMPFTISIGGYEGVRLFVFGLLAIALFMSIRNYIRYRPKIKEFKEENKDHYKKMNKILFYYLAKNHARESFTMRQRAMPVGPYMIIPFFIYLAIFPFL